MLLVLVAGNSAMAQTVFCAQSTEEIPDPGGTNPVISPVSSVCIGVNIDPDIDGAPTSLRMDLAHTWQGDLSIRVNACGNTLMILTRPGGGSCTDSSPFGFASALGTSNGSVPSTYVFSEGGTDPDGQILSATGGNYGISGDPCNAGTVSSFAALFAACPPGMVNAQVCLSDHAGGDMGFVSNVCFLTGPVPDCDISAAPGDQGACDDGDYTQDIIVTYTDPPASGTLEVNGEFFPILVSPQTITLTNLLADGLPMDLSASFSDFPGCSFFQEDAWTAPPSCLPLSLCSTDFIEIPDGFSKDEEPVVEPENATCTDIVFDLNASGVPYGISLDLAHPAQGDLSIRINACDNTLMILTRPGGGDCLGGFPYGNEEPLGTSGGTVPSTYTFIDGGPDPDTQVLPATGGSFGLSGDPCGANTVNSFAELFAACPQGIVIAQVCLIDHSEGDAGTASNICLLVPPCDISVSVDDQGACDDDEYTQDVTVFYTNAPATGTLEINGESFPILGSPQSITLTNLPADGSPVDLMASFSDNSDCAFFLSSAWTAPQSCATCPVTADFSVGDEFCSDAPIQWTAGSDCYVNGTPLGSRTGSGQVMDLYIYHSGGNYSAPPGYMINIPPATEYEGPNSLVALNPELEEAGLDFICSNTPLTSFTNETCDPIQVTYFLVVYDYNLNFDDDAFSEYNPLCEPSRFDMTIYPAPLRVETDGNFQCSNTVRLLAEDNTVCYSEPVTGCGVVSYDISTAVTWTPPAGCPLPLLAGDITLDVFPPDITLCPSDITIQCGTIPAPDINSVGYTENCPDAVVSWEGDSAPTGSCPATILRTYRVTDDCGLTDQCTQTFVLDDTEEPSIECPDGVGVSCAGDVPAADIGDVEAGDNCGIPVIQHIGDIVSSQTCTNRFTVTRTYRATDACLNSAECTQIIAVLDETPASIACPATEEVSCAGDVPAPNVNAVVSSDNCGVTVVTHAGDITQDIFCENQFTVLRTYLSTDDCGNTQTCVQSILVNDLTPPQLGDLPDLTINCEDPYPVDLPEASDDCDGAIVLTETFDETVLPGCPSSHLAIRVFTATDACGNTSVTTQSIWALDTEAPVFTYVPPDMTVECGEEYFVPQPIAEDNCWVCVIQYEEEVLPGACPGESVIVRTYQASDECGHFAYATHTIYVQDSKPPAIDFGPVFQSGDTLTLGCTQMLMFNPVLSDACDANVELVSEWVSATSGDCAADGYLTLEEYLLTATDDCGNSTEFTAFVRWKDDQPPYFHEYPQDLEIQCGSGLNIAEVEAWLSANGGGVAEELCSHFTWSYDLDPGSLTCDQTQTIPVVFTVTDACGNAATAVAQLTLIASPAALTICTHPESWYGQDDAMTVAYIGRLMQEGSENLVFGVPGRSITFTVAAAQCINGLLVSSGSVPVLPAGDILTGADCGVGNIYLTPDGRIKNRLLGQAIALALNLRGDADLGSLPLFQTCVPLDSYVYQQLGMEATVADLLGLANQLLGRAIPANSIRRMIVANQIKAINEYYASCASGCDNQNLSQAPAFAPNIQSLPEAGTASEKSGLYVMVFPNPAQDYFELQLNHATSEDCQVTILHESGALLQTMRMPAVNGQIRLDCRTWAAGMYLIRVNTAAGYGVATCLKL